MKIYWAKYDYKIPNFAKINGSKNPKSFKINATNNSLKLYQNQSIKIEISCRISCGI